VKFLLRVGGECLNRRKETGRGDVELDQPRKGLDHSVKYGDSFRSLDIGAQRTVSTPRRKNELIL